MGQYHCFLKIRTGIAKIRYGYVFYAWEMVSIQAFNGAGDTMTPTRLNFVAYWLIQIPLGWWLSRTALGADGIYAAICISQNLAAVALMVLFIRGSWKTREL